MYLREKLEKGEFVVLAELTPPKGVDATEMLEAAGQIGTRVDGLVVSEMTGAVMRMSSLGAAALLQQKGFQSVLEIHCRDRNRLALQADLLAAGALGIRNVIVTSPDEPQAGDHPEAKAVYDLQALDLLEALRSLQAGRDLGGGELQGSPGFLVGATARTHLRGAALEKEVEELGRKADKGAACFLSPPLFDLESIEPFLKAVKGTGLKLLPTVLLLKSVGMARYIDAHIDHIVIPSGLIERLQKAEDVYHEALRVASEMVSRLKSAGFAGVCLSAVGWELKIPEILAAAGRAGNSLGKGDSHE